MPHAVACAILWSRCGKVDATGESQLREHRGVDWRLTGVSIFVYVIEAAVLQRNRMRACTILQILCASFASAYVLGFFPARNYAIELYSCQHTYIVVMISHVLASFLCYHAQGWQSPRVSSIMEPSKR